MSWQIIVGILFLIGGFSSIAESFSTFLLGLVLGACLILWGLKMKGIFSKGSKGTRFLSEETFRAVGVSYYKGSIEKLACDNPKWNRSPSAIVSDGDAGHNIFKYNYANKPIELKVEKNNPHDPNAVAVYIAENLVGYISREENTRVREILTKREIISISGFIGGGPYKVVSNSREVITDEANHTVTVRIKYI